MQDYILLIDDLITYCNDNKFLQEEEEKKYFLHVASVKLQDIKSLLGLISEISTMFKLLIALKWEQNILSLFFSNYKREICMVFM